MIVMFASSKLPSIFWMRVLFVWINVVVLMAHESQHALARVTGYGIGSLVSHLTAQVMCLFIYLRVHVQVQVRAVPEVMEQVLLG
jgi:hypothetical protein